jgi:hypothetical protein
MLPVYWNVKITHLFPQNTTYTHFFPLLLKTFTAAKGIGYIFWPLFSCENNLTDPGKGINFTDELRSTVN